jgi:hypothetical protein
MHDVMPRWALRFGWPLPKLAGGAGDADGAEGGTEEGAPAAPPAPSAAPAFDPAPILDRMGAIEERLGGFNDLMSGLHEQLQPPPADPLDELFEGVEAESLTPEQARQMLGYVMQQNEQGTQQAIEQALAPILAEREEERIEHAAMALEERMPELKDEVNAEAAVRATVEFVNGLKVSDDAKRQLVRNVDLIGALWTASKAQQSPGGGAPQTGDENGGVENELVGGQAAVPGGDEDDPAARIVNAGSRGGWMW